MKNKILVVMAVSVLSTVSFSSATFAEWKYGIGTGISALDIDGDVSVESSLGGTETLDVNLSPAETSDVLDTAFGFGGYATDGKWLITYSYGKFQLEDDTTVGSDTVDVTAEHTQADLAVGYSVYQEGSFVMNLSGGVRLFSRDLDTEFTSGATTISNSRDNSWTDAVIGVDANYKFAPAWVWANHADASFGDSEGTSSFKTGLNWQFAKSWSASLAVKMASVELKNGNTGDEDYYEYDADETSTSASFLYHF